MRVDCCHLRVHNAFWLDVVCLSVYHKRPALALRPTVNRINGMGGCQRFSHLTHSTHSPVCAVRVSNDYIAV